jgi:preprotein translocase SecE subunit
MAIVQKRNSLADISLVEEGQIETSEKDTVGSDKVSNKKPKGLIQSTLDEVRKVDWPSFGYVLKWSITILVFTFIFAIALGVFDHIFRSGVLFVDCSSPQGKNRGLSQCGNELLLDLTFANQA